MSEECKQPSWASLEITYEQTSQEPDPADDCSAWVWCPCYQESSYSICSRGESSCPESPSCPPECSGDGGWYLLCGDGCLGPPCYVGEWFGEVSFICRCPEGSSEESIPLSSSSIDIGSLECIDDFSNFPFPYNLPFGAWKAGINIKSLLTSGTLATDGALTAWTWCPCEGEPNEYPSTDTWRIVSANGSVTPQGVLGEGYALQGTHNGKYYYSDLEWYIWADTDGNWHITDTLDDLTSVGWTYAEDTECPIGIYSPFGGAEGSVEVLTHCPDAGVCTEEGDGRWIWRGGPSSLGPPPVTGRFYGETLFVGFCCNQESSSSQSISYTSEESSLCDLPAFDVFDWDLVDKTQSQWDSNAGNAGLTDGSECLSLTSSTGWVWCPCESNMDPCPVSYDETYDEDTDCPYSPTTPTSIDGEWVPISMDSGLGTPCRAGRFYGEVVFLNECDIPSSLSSSLSSPSGPGT